MSHKISDCSTVSHTKMYNTECICLFCHNKWSRPTDVARHVKYHCLQNPEAQCHIRKANNRFVCQKCGRRFKLLKGLTYHEKHECQKSVICQLCKKTFVGANLSRRHIELCMQNNQRRLSEDGEVFAVTKKKRRYTRTKELTAVVPPPVKDEDFHSELILSASDHGD